MEERMVSTKGFNKGIIDIIERCSYYFYTIKRDTDVKCTCITSATNQPNPACKKCLGTGFKIRIIKVKGAGQDGQLPPTFRSDRIIVSRNFYIQNDIQLQEDDLIIDNNQVFFVFENQDLIGLSGTIPYRVYLTLRKKYDSKLLLKNFNEVLEEIKNDKR